ncbi:MAG TPA: VIT domain-containing protein [Polyangiaceae bacterium]|nr:VIT domain-containing protein [Polyangiaceae bacterium]
MASNRIPSDPLCEAARDRVADLLDGTAPVELVDHVASCDRCRDLRHDASQLASMVAAAGDDFRPIADLEARLFAALDGRAPAPPPEPGAASLAVHDTHVSAHPYGGGTQATAPFGPTYPTPAGVPTSGIVASQSPGGATSQVSSAGLTASPVTPLVPTASPPAAAPAPAPAKGPARPGSARARALRAWAREFRGPLVGLVASLAVAAIALLFVQQGRQKGRPDALGQGAAEVRVVARADGGSGGLTSCRADGSSCQPIDKGAGVKPGWLVRTDGRTRAELGLGDGSIFAVDRDAELVLRDDGPRSLRLTRGAIVADVAHVEGAPRARVAVPGGEIEVVGTKFAVEASGDVARVAVTRGEIVLRDARGGRERVRAGEEGRVGPKAPLRVVPSTSVADALAWTETLRAASAPAGGEGGLPPDEPVRGLGELRAKKPGQQSERDTALRLSKHSVTVRIVDNVARTEVEEAFENETGDELEGIYRFPLPPDAQIERLALEVNGKLEEAAFVERDKAAAIWRGVIQHAVLKAPKPVEEIIWVPGPWRDPALLEWQRGGRFELRIFPIAPKSRRRVVIAYTQTVPLSGGLRRYTYPLPYDPRGSTSVDDFTVDVQVLGHDKALGVKAIGYALQPGAPGGDARAERLGFQQARFVPTGDLQVEYGLPDRDAELSAWAYRPADVKPGEDGSPYVVLALRPKLPRVRETKARDHVLLVDASRSMVGERYARARALASSLVREMDADDRVRVLACDTTCRPLGSTALEPGGPAAESVATFLEGITPDGASDLAAIVRAAQALPPEGARARHLVYIGDGGASVGTTRPDRLGAEVTRALGANATLTAVAVGADADTTVLAALARGGGGPLLPYVPGQRASLAAANVLAASAGAALRTPALELPPGLSAVAPSALDTMLAGSETLVVARMAEGELAGEAVLRGKVGDQPFEQRYPLRLAATSDAGNAFVPRVFAAQRIAELERSGAPGSKEAIVELSKKFAVASRHTSLLVLESEAMFKAFGLDRTRLSPSWTGDVAANASSAAGLLDVGAGDEDEVATEGAEAQDGKGSGRAGLAHRRAPARSAPAAGPSLADDADPFGGVPGGVVGGIRGGGGSAEKDKREESRKEAKRDAPFDASNPWASPPANEPPRGPPRPAATVAPPPPPADAAPATKSAPRARPAKPAIVDRESPWDDDRRQRRGFVPMRRVFERRGSVALDLAAFHAREAAKVSAAESALAVNPDSRKATQELFGLVAQHGPFERAADLAERWAGRDALDPEALVARADVAARRGDREAALRILAGVVDLRPGDAAAQNRLADLFDRAGEPLRACAHRVALAESRPSDVDAQAGAQRCARGVGWPQLADGLSAELPADKRKQLDAAMAKAPDPSPQALRGDVQIEASWGADADLDLALIDRKGVRYSWLGGVGKARVTSRDVRGRHAEAVAFAGLPQGEYVLEVSHADPAAGSLPVHGILTVRAVNETRQIPFTLAGPRAEAGRVRVFFEAKLVPL